MSYMSVADPGETFHGTVSFIEPVMDSKSRSVRVRVEVPNTQGLLLPEMFLTGRIEAVVGENSLVVPELAVIRSGVRDLVILDLGQGRMAPREVTLGHRVDGFYEVKSGLRAGDKVIDRALFLVDSESQLKSALEKMGSDAAMPSMPGMSH
jgi:Cu(I)/Ag(I) efflux system membrane fusion protein